MQDVNKFGPKMDFLFSFSLEFNATVLEHQYQWDHILFSLLGPLLFRTCAHLFLPMHICVKWLCIFPMESLGYDELKRSRSHHSKIDSVFIVSHLNSSTIPVSRSSRCLERCFLRGVSRVNISTMSAKKSYHFWISIQGCKMERGILSVLG